MLQGTHASHLTFMRACQGRKEGVQGCLERERDAYEPDQQCCRGHKPDV